MSKRRQIFLPRERRGGTARNAVAVAGLTVTAVVVATLPGLAMTNASWTDTEWDHASTIGVLDCATTDGFVSRADGTFLGVNVLGMPLASIADASGLAVVRTATPSTTVSPATAPEIGGVGSNIFGNPLNVSALNGALTADLTGQLAIPLGAPVGTLNEYAQAQGSGYSAGASGLINNSGGLVDIGSYPAAGDIPKAAQLNLASVVSSALGSAGAALVDQVTALDLGVGAVGGVAQLNGCEADFTKDLAASLVRDYLIAGLDLDVTSPLVGDLVTGVSSTVTGLQGVVNGLAGNGGVVPALTTGITNLLGSLLSGLSLGSVSASLTATADFTAVNNLLTAIISDSGGIVEIDLANGGIGVDLAKLLGGVNGLNSLDPNTELLVNATVINTLTEALLDALGQWVTDVQTALQGSLDAITVSGSVTTSISALGIKVLDIGITLTGASLASLLTNTTPPANATITLNVLSIVKCDPPISPLDLVSKLVCPLLTGILSALTNGLRGVVGGVVLGLLTPLTTGLTTTLNTLTTAGTSPIVRLLGLLLDGLFGMNGVASLLVNAQNDPLSGGPEPGDWGAIPFGRYDVAALRVGVLGLLGPDGDVDIVLARGSVGANARP